MQPDHISGIDVARLFYENHVHPVLTQHFFQPFSLPHAASLIGHGSEVLGFDTKMSEDHDFGPRCQIFLLPAHHQLYAEQMHSLLSRSLPKQFLQFSTHFGSPDAIGVRLLESLPEDADIVEHKVEILTVESYFLSYVGIDVHSEMTYKDWLSIPQQKLLAVTSGAVFRDDFGLLTNIRSRLKYYPDDVHLYICKAQWRKIGNESAFVGRSGICGDNIGSMVLASQIVHECMRLCFLLEKKYFPYSKWFGSAFAKLDCANEMQPLLEDVLLSQPVADWKERERRLTLIYTKLVDLHNRMMHGAYGDQVPPVSKDLVVAQFHQRPFITLHDQAIIDQIDQVLQNTESSIIPYNANLNLGSINQISNQVEILENPPVYNALCSAVYQGL